MARRPIGKLCILLSIAVLAMGCGSGSGSGGVSMVPPVQAQSSYSSATVAGTYSVYLAEGYTETLLGSFIADGKGNISSGSLIENNGGGPTSICTVSITGSYTVQSSASGTATISSSAPGLVGCPGSGNSVTSIQFNIQAGQQGDTVLFVGSGTQMFSGVATKQ